MTDLHTHPDYLAALRAIHVAGDDNLERLRLADWLDERAASVACSKCDGIGRVDYEGVNGRTFTDNCDVCHGTGRVGDGLGERAEFIRVQCGIAAFGRERVRLLNDGTNWSACTGLAANWCPNCGDCRCEDREESMSDPDCPLHSPGGDHCRLETLDYTTEALRRRERELLARVDKWGPYIVGLLSSGTEEVLIRTGEGGAVPVEFDRGFPSVVRGPLAGLWQVCDGCDGTGQTGHGGVRFGPKDCPGCSGRGHAGALAALGPEVLAVSRVEVTDKRASELGSGWSWFRFVGLNDTDALPSDVFDHLPDEDASLSMQGDRLTYASPTLAHAALSAAVLGVACRPWLAK